jgi:hypothetical protein
MFHDHELVLDHGTAGACPPARSSVITRRTMITALQAAPTPSGVPCQPAQHVSTAARPAREHRSPPSTSARPARAPSATGIRAARLPRHPAWTRIRRVSPNPPSFAKPSEFRQTLRVSPNPLSFAKPSEDPCPDRRAYQPGRYQAWFGPPPQLSTSSWMPFDGFELGSSRHSPEDCWISELFGPCVQIWLLAPSHGLIIT